MPVPVVIDGETEMMTADEGIREGTTAESLAKPEAGVQGGRPHHRGQLCRSPTVRRPC
ncbi:MAG: hypothetical protein R2705_05515 [Ilumatobacteraceae bacterium]